jgi:hypothetical protein
MTLLIILGGAGVGVAAPTAYFLIQGVRKRSFRVNAKMPGRIQATAINNDDTRIARNGDTRIARNGDTRVSHNMTPAYAQIRVIIGVKKRSFRVNAKINHE